MALSDCEICWQTPCICGKQGYTVIERNDVSSDDVSVMVDVLITSGITKEKCWEAIVGLSNINTANKSHLTKMKEYHMLSHLMDHLIKEVDKRSCDLLNTNVDIDRQSTKLNNILKNNKGVS